MWHGSISGPSESQHQVLPFHTGRMLNQTNSGSSSSLQVGITHSRSPSPFIPKHIIIIFGFVAGFGWFADNIWLQGIAIIMPAGAHRVSSCTRATTDHFIHPCIIFLVANEWRGYPTVRLATLALYVGLIIGAVFWGTTCDVWGYVFSLYRIIYSGLMIFITFLSPLSFSFRGRLSMPYTHTGYLYHSPHRGVTDCNHATS